MKHRRIGSLLGLEKEAIDNFCSLWLLGIQVGKNPEVRFDNEQVSTSPKCLQLAPGKMKVVRLLPFGMVNFQRLC